VSLMGCAGVGRAINPDCDLVGGLLESIYYLGLLLTSTVLLIEGLAESHGVVIWR